jgi:arginyl-tRNA synthetase
MFQIVYKRLGIHPDLTVQGESFYNPLIPATLQDLASKNMITTEDGAKLVWVKSNKKKKAKKKKKKKNSKKDDGEKDGKAQKKKGPPEGMLEVPLIAQKGDGGYGYDSTDLCAVQYRLETMKCDSVFYCVDAGQSLHFDLIFGAARQAGWATEKHRLEHIKFGVVTGEDGTRIKTRSGKSTLCSRISILMLTNSPSPTHHHQLTHQHPNRYQTHRPPGRSRAQSKGGTSETYQGSEIDM